MWSEIATLADDEQVTVLVDLDAADSGAAAAALGRLRGLSDVTAEGGTVRARAVAGAGTVPAVVDALAAAGLEAASITVGRPSLDDVYLAHVGRSLEAAA